MYVWCENEPANKALVKLSDVKVSKRQDNSMRLLLANGASQNLHWITLSVSKENHANECLRLETALLGLSMN